MKKTQDTKNNSFRVRIYDDEVLTQLYELANLHLYGSMNELMNEALKQGLEKMYLTAGKQKKFAEQLTHRDYLGAIMNLGIERCKIGDILLEGDTAVLFVHRALKQFVMDELYKIRHTSVVVTEVEEQDFFYQPNTKELKGTVSSLRLDSLISLAFASSRSKLVTYIENGKVFVNGKLITSNGYQIKENDIVSVRGLGRFQFKESLSQTKKGRYYVAIDLYI